MTADELEVVSVEGEEVCPDTSRTQCEEYVVQHLLDFRLAAGFLSGNLRNQFAGFLPVLERRSHKTTSSFQSPHLAVYQTYSPLIQSPRIEFLDHHTGEICLKDQRQEVTLKERRSFVRLESEQIDICVKQDGHTRYL